METVFGIDYQVFIPAHYSNYEERREFLLILLRFCTKFQTSSSPSREYVLDFDLVFLTWNSKFYSPNTKIRQTLNQEGDTAP